MRISVVVNGYGVGGWWSFVSSINKNKGWQICSYMILWVGGGYICIYFWGVSDRACATNCVTGFKRLRIIFDVLEFGQTRTVNEHLRLNSGAVVSRFHHIMWAALRVDPALTLMPIQGLARQWRFGPCLCGGLRMNRNIVRWYIWSWFLFSVVIIKYMGGFIILFILSCKSSNNSLFKILIDILIIL